MKAPGAPHSVTGLASWYMGSGFFGGGFGNLVSLLLVSNYPAVINYKIFQSTVGSSPYSVILVQFKNRDWDADYPDSATRKLSSEYVFKNEKNCSKLWEYVPCIRMYIQLGDEKLKTAARSNLDFIEFDVAEKYYAIAAFGLTAQVYSCLNLDDGVDGDIMDLNNDLSDIFKWPHPIPEIAMNSNLKEEDEDGVNQIVWRLAREMP